MPKQPTPIDPVRYNELKSRGLSDRQIAKEMGIPESTFRHRKKSAENLEGGPKAPKSIHESKPEVDLGIPSTPKENIQLDYSGKPDSDQGTLFQEIIEFWPTLQEMFKWWDDRKASSHLPQEKLERFTFHIQPKWMEAIKRESDKTGETYAAVVNRAFSKYFGGK